MTKLEIGCTCFGSRFIELTIIRIPTDLCFFFYKIFIEKFHNNSTIRLRNLLGPFLNYVFIDFLYIVQCILKEFPGFQLEEIELQSSRF